MFKVSVVLLLEYMRTLTTSVEWKSSIFVKPLHWKIFRGDEVFVDREMMLDENHEYKNLLQNMF